MNKIRLSEMQVGDRGYLMAEGVDVVLRDGGKAGGCEHDLWLAMDDEAVAVEALPVIIMDTDEVSV